MLEQILRKLFCLHEWDKKGTSERHRNDGTLASAKIFFVCKKCGKFKVVTM